MGNSNQNPDFAAILQNEEQFRLYVVQTLNAIEVEVRATRTELKELAEEIQKIKDGNYD